MKSWKVMLAVAVIFCAGAVTGGVTAHLLQRQKHLSSPRPFLSAPPGRGGLQSAELLRRLDRELQLQAEQRRRIEKILKDSQERIRRLWNEVSPRAGDELRQTRERIKGELSPEQRSKFERLEKRNQRRAEDPQNLEVKREWPRAPRPGANANATSTSNADPGTATSPAPNPATHQAPPPP